MSALQDDLERIRAAMEVALEPLKGFSAEDVRIRLKVGSDPLTLADQAVNETLRRVLPHDSEGWLSEETRDDFERMQRWRVWVVDPVDGTREFVARIQEYFISIGLVEDGSRSEVGGSELEGVGTAPFSVRAVGSVAYELALVTSGLADATFTPDGSQPVFNKRVSKLAGLVASAPGLRDPLRSSPRAS